MDGDGYNNGFSFPSIELLKWVEVLLQRGLRERGGKEFWERHGYLFSYFLLFLFLGLNWGWGVVFLSPGFIIMGTSSGTVTSPPRARQGKDEEELHGWRMALLLFKLSSFCVCFFPFRFLKEHVKKVVFPLKTREECWLVKGCSDSETREPPNLLCRPINTPPPPSPPNKQQTGGLRSVSLSRLPCLPSPTTARPQLFHCLWPDLRSAAYLSCRHPDCGSDSSAQPPQPLLDTHPAREREYRFLPPD
ncbi:hypothetical protein VTJ04DRAFT_3381 [Mycothermus thermophilus]|uniref:uncharacterized protein n=1 Tax=Humicola insolens TaxID=85995 RepID=UPI0037430DB2